jgi:hypothetical protein
MVQSRSAAAAPAECVVAEDKEFVSETPLRVMKSEGGVQEAHLENLHT